MIRSAILAALAMSVAACAAPAAHTGDGTAAALPPAAASGAASGPAQTDGAGGIIEVVEVPKAAAAAEQPRPETRRGRVCRLEKRTGTNRAVRVCRTVAQIEKEALESKRVFDKIRRSQREYDH